MPSAWNAVNSATQVPWRTELGPHIDPRGCLPSDGRSPSPAAKTPEMIAWEIPPPFEGITRPADIADGEHVVIHHALDRAPHRYPTSAIGHDLQPQAVTEASEMFLDIAFETASARTEANVRSRSLRNDPSVP